MPAFGIGLVVACLARYSPSGAIHWHTPEQERRLIVAAVRAIDPLAYRELHLSSIMTNSGA